MGFLPAGAETVIASATGTIAIVVPRALPMVVSSAAASDGVLFDTTAIALSITVSVTVPVAVPVSVTFTVGSVVEA